MTTQSSQSNLPSASNQAPPDQSFRNEFEHLESMFTEFAELEDGPRRAQLRESLIIGFLPMARRLASKYRDHNVAVEDLVQIASVGLVNAVDRFGPRHGVPFLGFAIPTITGEIRHYFRDRTWSTKVPRSLKERHQTITQATAVLGARLNRAPRPSELASHLELSVDQVIEGLHAGEVYSSASLDEPLTTDGGAGGEPLAEILGEADARLELVEYRHTLRPLLEARPERGRTIVMLRFFSEMTQSEIATEIGVSQMHVSRLLTKVLTKLRVELQQD